jgi:hypothetical protein
MTSTHDTDMTTSADPDRDDTSERLDTDYPADGHQAADDQAVSDQAVSDQTAGGQYGTDRDGTDRDGTDRDGEHDGPPFAVGQNGTVTPGTAADDGDETYGSAGTGRAVSDTDPDLIIVAETVDEVPATTNDTGTSGAVTNGTVTNDSVIDGNLATSQTVPDQPAAVDPAATGVTATGTAATAGAATDTTDQAAQAQDYDRRWSELQALFVDDPRASVERAARLVNDEIEALVQAARQQQESLSTWRDTDADTEALRNALRSYRTFWGTVHEELARQS